MGYTIRIGNVVSVEPNAGTTHYDSSLFTVEPRALSYAPRFDTANPGRNESWPSYSEVRARSKLLGLEAFFLDEDHGLLRPHPGIRALNRAHVDTLSSTLRAVQDANPDVVPCFEGSQPPLAKALAWLVWFEFWARLAVARFKRPGVENT